MSVLKQLNIPFKYQYSPEWIFKLRYDFYFVFNEIEYIVELDGGLGHGHENYPFSDNGNSLERDKIKDEAAHSRGLKLIRIDCDYYRVDSRNQYIKNSIINSELSDIFDFDCVDFNECNKYALIKFREYISELWNSGIRGYDNLHKYIPVERPTLRMYLRDASEIGLIKESYDEVLKINRKYSNKKLQASKGTMVKCNETGEVFVSISEAARQYSKYHTSGLLNYFYRGDKYCGVLPDGTKLTWTKLENENVS